MRMYENKGGCGPEYSTLYVSESYFDDETLKVRVESAYGGRGVGLTPRQVDDLIEQLCAFRGIDSPVKVGAVPEITETRPREVVVGWIDMGTGHRNVVVRNRGGRIEVWQQRTSPLWSREERNDGNGTWFSGYPDAVHEALWSNPAYLRAVADVMENPNETVVVSPGRPGVDGVSGDGFTIGGAS